MADNDQHDEEYHFAELDPTETKSGEEEYHFEDSESSKKNQDAAEKTETKNVLRNALIAVGIVVFILLTWKLISWISSRPKSVATIPAVKMTPKTEALTPEPVAVKPAAPVVPETVVVASTDSGLKQKVSDMEQSLETVKAEVKSIEEQITNINSNVNALNTQMANINQVLNNLSSQLARQSEIINTLIVKTSPPKLKFKKVNLVPVKRIVYYIQAVIPGRAWLIGSNGSTLTVREGTKVPGYGVVKLIDSLQGRILTSSGQLIRFSQDDS